MGVAIEALKTEHRAIKRMLDVLDAVCGRLRTGERIDPAHANQIIEFFHAFADRCHHGKEEEIFFPALEMAGMPKEGGPIGVMLHEHDQMRVDMKGLTEAAGRYQAGETNAGADIIRYASDYAAMLRRHIEKEHHVLFQMAEQHLSPEDEQELAERFEALEAETMGTGAQENLHALLDRMQGMYVGDQSGSEGKKKRNMGKGGLEKKGRIKD
jgi:hemerythrin-like domain-containing protein